VATPFAVEMRMQRFYFDRQRVATRLGRQATRALNRGGTYVRREARKLLRKRKHWRPSAPGKPPNVHTDSDTASLRNIQYYSDGAFSILVGPVRLPGRRNRPPVPELLEKGGTVGIIEGLEAAPANSASPVEWLALNGRKPREGQPTRTRQATYAPRPFMLPALRRVAPKLPDLFSPTASTAVA